MRDLPVTGAMKDAKCWYTCFSSCTLTALPLCAFGERLVAAPPPVLAAEAEEEPAGDRGPFGCVTANGCLVSEGATDALWATGEQWER